MRFARVVAICVAVLACGAAEADFVRVADSVRDSRADEWATPDVEFARAVTGALFEEAGMTPVRVSFDAESDVVVSNVEVICSAFRAPSLIEAFDFPMQPIGRMHYALYATPSRARLMMRTKINNWPSLRVAYSRVSQGDTDDREKYFEHAGLKPAYVEYPTSTEAVNALKAGEVDALFLYTPFGKRPEDLVEIVPIGDRNVYFAVRKDRPDIMRRLATTYRRRYIDNIDAYDSLRERLLGVPRPKRRVRVAAYCRGDLFDVSPDGMRTGVIEEWLKAIAAQTKWDLDYVYGGYDESLDSVKEGKLDIVGGVGFAPIHREDLLFPHTPVGMLRVYLWSRAGSRYKPGEPESWRGMRIGMLAGSQSAQRVEAQMAESDLDITCKEYNSEGDLETAYAWGEVDACVDVEKPSLAKAVALHVYASHPMYICASLARKDLFNELESALDDICDDFPRYMRMISERHYGFRSGRAVLSLKEAEWLRKRIERNPKVLIDLSPWPYSVVDEHGNATGFPGMLFSEISRRTGLKFRPFPQADIQTAEARFLRGETEFWVPYPEKPPLIVSGMQPVFSLPVPRDYALMVGAAELNDELSLVAGNAAPPELINIIRKTVATIDAETIHSMFMKAVADREVVHRVFGLTAEELKHVILVCSASVLAIMALYGFVMVCMYRRQAKRAAVAASEAEHHAQAKTRFLAAMSHELRTPLNAVIGFAEFLSTDGAASRRAPEYVQGILTSATALLELINDILDFSKLEAGAFDMRADTCDVEKLVDDLKAIFGYRVRKHGVVLIVRRASEDRVPLVRLSRQGLRQILINVVGNAAKFTLKGRIAVLYSWDRERKSLRIDVRDTGLGISEVKMGRLFDPFVQDIASRMKDQAAGIPKGTGLGLPIVKRLVDQAGGTIKVTSSQGKGTTFSIVIPELEVVYKDEEEDLAAQIHKTAHLPEPAGRRKSFNRVLVVDDTPLNRKVLGIHLEHIGIKEIRYAENGVKALETMRDWRPDIVLTDMWMPEMDGSQLVRAMGRVPAFSDIPVVAVTADVDVGSTYDMSRFARVVPKPVTREKLKEIFAEG